MDKSPKRTPKPKQKKMAAEVKTDDKTPTETLQSKAGSGGKKKGSK
jgi:hypothetical protein